MSLPLLLKWLPFCATDTGLEVVVGPFLPLYRPSLYRRRSIVRSMPFASCSVPRHLGCFVKR
jgi:hypothetical protein